MERLTRWAIAGSLVWLLVATGLILATHGRAAADESGHALEAPAASWSSVPVSMDIEVAFQAHQC